MGNVSPWSIRSLGKYSIRSSRAGIHRVGKYLKILDTENINTEPQIYWNKCECNEFDALTRRHCLGHIPGYVPGNPQMKILETEVEAFAKLVPSFGVSSFQEVMKNTRPKIRNRYREAYHNLRTNRVGYSPILARLDTFVKYEKIPIGKYLDGRPPRLIQHRTYEYLYLLKAHLQQYSLWMKGDGKMKEINGQRIGTIFAKLHNNYGQASILRECWDSYSNPIAICLDHSKFDGHYCEELLAIEHKFWTTNQKSKLLKRLLGDQLDNKGRTQNGLIYKVRGTRTSGEWTTSEGNGLLNYCMLATWCKSSGINQFKIVVNGDDSVVFIDKADQKRLLPLTFFRNFNMDTECDRIVEDFQRITFCQASPIRVFRENQLCWYMVKDPNRSISRLQYCDINYDQCVSRFMAGIGLCELAVSTGIPIMQSVAIKMLHLSGLERPLASVDREPAAMSGNVAEINEINSETRSDFALAFGISEYEQIITESGIAGNLMTPTVINYIQKYSNFPKIKLHL